MASTHRSVACLALALAAAGCTSDDRLAAESAASWPVTTLAFAALRHHADTGDWPSSAQALAAYDSTGWAGYAGRDIGFRPDGLREFGVDVIDDSTAELTFAFDSLDVEQDTYVHYVDEETGGYGAAEWIAYRPLVIRATGTVVLVGNGQGGRGSIEITEAEVRLPGSGRLLHLRGLHRDITTFVSNGRLYLH